MHSGYGPVILTYCAAPGFLKALRVRAKGPAAKADAYGAGNSEKLVVSAAAAEVSAEAPAAAAAESTEASSDASASQTG